MIIHATGIITLFTMSVKKKLVQEEAIKHDYECNNSKDTNSQIHRLKIHKEVALSTILYSINQTTSSDSFDLINT